MELRRLRGWYERHGESGPQLVNMYGITETTVHVTYVGLTAEMVKASRGSVIGGNIPDLRIYVLDPNPEPVAVGVVGEMYVGGAGLARGYLKRAGLTAERFLLTPMRWSRVRACIARGTWDDGLAKECSSIGDEQISR